MGIILIGLGGALGSILRYGLTVATQGAFGLAFPYGTLLVNFVGSLALGLLMEVAPGRELLGTQATLVLGTGLLGGFTTYSSFNLETLRLLEQGATGRAIGYLVATVGLCLIAGALGIALGRAARSG